MRWRAACEMCSVWFPAKLQTAAAQVRLSTSRHFYKQFNQIVVSQPAGRACVDSDALWCPSEDYTHTLLAVRFYLFIYLVGTVYSRHSVQTVTPCDDSLKWVVCDVPSYSTFSSHILVYYERSHLYKISGWEAENTVRCLIAASLLLTFYVQNSYKTCAKKLTADFVHWQI